jgi:hypothetical protein
MATVIYVFFLLASSEVEAKGTPLFLREKDRE